jgi:hypothetical protein
MAYFIFQVNQPNVSGSLYKIAANDNDLSNQNIDKNNYNIITDTDANFTSVQLGTQNVISYSSTNVITYEQTPSGNVFFNNSSALNSYIKNYSNQINNFIQINPSNPWLSTWVSYNTQLLNTNVTAMTYPMTISLEQYYKNNNLPVLNPLQLP